MTRTGRLLSGWGIAEGEVQLGVTRKSLHDVLLRAAGPDALVSAKTCTGFEQDENSVTATFEDGSSVRGDLLLGADGLRSVVRAQLHGEQAPALRRVRRCRKAHRPGRRAEPPLPPGVVRLFWGPGASFGMYHVGPGIVYIFGWQKGPEGEHERGRRKQEWLERYKDWSPEINELIGRTEEESIHQTDIYDRPPAVERWGDGACEPRRRCRARDDVQHGARRLPGVRGHRGADPGAGRTRCDAGGAARLRGRPQGARRPVHESLRPGVEPQRDVENPLGWRLRNLVLRGASKRVSKGEEALKIEVSETVAKQDGGRGELLAALGRGKYLSIETFKRDVDRRDDARLVRGRKRPCLLPLGPGDAQDEADSAESRGDGGGLQRPRHGQRPADVPARVEPSCRSPTGRASLRRTTASTGWRRCFRSSCSAACPVVTVIVVYDEILPEG